MDVAKRLFALFPADFDRLTRSMIIIVTKVVLDDFESVDDVIIVLKDIIKENQNLGTACRAMINGIISEGNVCIMPRPNNLKVEHISQLKDKINNIAPTMLTADATISLSH